jgi:NTE family protein
MAAADTAIDAGVRAGFTAFETVNADWQTALVRWRCGLSAAERKRLGAPANWNCRDLKFFIGRVNFEQLGNERARKLNAIQTRFKLPEEDVDTLIAAGADSVRGNGVYQAFLASLR